MPVLEIEKNPDAAYEYTAKGNLVAVVSNGTAILGLGNRGALASKPVMEGKGVLFKRFAGIDVFDIELNAPDPQDVIRICQRWNPLLAASTWKTSRRRSVLSSKEAKENHEYSRVPR